MRVSDTQVRRDSKLFEELCAALLRRGQAVRFRANGQSMNPNIQDGADVVVAPAHISQLDRGDVVLARGNAGFRLHRIAQVDALSEQVITRGDSGLENDPATQEIFGKVTSAGRGRQARMSGCLPRLRHSLRSFFHRIKLGSARRFKQIGSISGLIFALVLFAATVNAPSASAQALGITNAAAPATIAPGATITLTQVLSNTSGKRVNAPVTVTQNLPTGTSFTSGAVSGSGTWNATPCALAAGVITCTESANYATGSTTTITITLNVNANVASGTVITDTVNATGSNTGTATASASVTVQAPDLALTQTVAPSVVAPSTNFTYTEAVSNNGPTSTSVGTVTITTQTPANATYQSFTGTNWTCGTLPAVGGTGNIVCTYTPALASGASASSLTLTMQVAAGTASGTVVQNSATVGDTYFTDPYPYNNTSTSSITVEPAGTADLALIQTASPDSVSAGSNFVYTETATNNGPAATTTGTVSVATQTPANTTYQSFAGTNWTCGTLPAVGGTGNITCTYNAALAVGATASALTITVGVNTGTASGTVIQNSATVSNSALTDPINSNNTSTTLVTVEAAGTADLQLIQVASAPAVAAGDNYYYTETVVDNGPTTATSGTITVYMQTPPNTNYQSYSGTNWSCTPNPVVPIGPIVCTYNAALTSGATAATLTVTFQVAVWAANTAYAVGTRIVDSNGNIEQVVTAGTSGGTAPTWATTLGTQTTDNGVTWQNAGPAAGTTIQSSATVTNSTLVDPIPSNNTSITSIVIEPTSSADMSLSMSVAPTPVFIATNLTYTIQVQNLGQISAPATTNVLTDTLPTGVTFVSVTSSPGWSCSGTTTVSCSLTTPMPMGASSSIAITVTAPASATTLTNTATISLSGDPNSTNNSATAYTVVQPLVCATPGKDGAGGSLTGVVNAYYAPSTAGTLAAGSTSVALRPAAAGGAQTTINAGDLLLVIQMQAAAVNDTNTSSYGHGVPGDPATGSTNLSSSGLFEFVTATNQVVAASGGTLKFTGTGPTGGLLNSYYENAASAAQGQQTYQIIRVPQYTSATLSSTLVPLAWNGSIGGVLAIDASSQLTLGGTVVADALGFRGGGGITLAGQTTGANTDYVTNSPTALPALNNTTQKDPPAGSGANASKGEGIAGTPHWIAPALSAITTSSTAVSTGQSVVEGLPNGSFARGGPGNAGGGGTDGNPSGNTENSGGGAGANGGAGGQGGYGWDSLTATNSTNGGFGGSAFPASTSALVMGGAGGAGTTNNGSFYTSTSNGADCGTTCTGIYSSGGAGGGIVIIHAGSVAGTGTITSNGQATLSTLNDSTGGAGAGGSILVFANSGGLSGLTVNAAGGSAGNAWPNEAPGGFPGQRHGPGGGGGGGVIFLSATPASSNVSAGSNGYTDTVQDSYGATPGTAGVLVTTDIITETPGTQPGAYCASADLAVTNAGTPSIVAPGGNITYTQTVTNNGPFDAVNAVFSEGIPANTTFQSIVPAAGWTCTTPAVGGTGNITCTDPDVANAGTGTFTVVVQVAGATTTGTQIVDVDNVTSGTSDPNLANNSATVTTSVGTSTEADLSITNTSSASTVVAGSTFTFTAVVTNNGPAVAASGAVFTEVTASNNAATPTNATFASLVPPANWTCSTPAAGSAGTITCTLNPGFTLAVGATATFPVVMTAPTTAASGSLPGMVLSSTAYIADATPDPNTANNFATASIEVASSGQADLAVTSTGTPNPVTPGNNISYAQSVTNNGPTAITASATTTVTFTDTIPTNTTLASTFTAPTGWTCTPTIAIGGTGTFTCTLNSGQILAVGAVVNFPLVVKVNATTSTGATTVGTTITNSPSVASSVSDPNTTNNTATVTTYVASPSSADVSINKTASPNPVNQGTTLTYTLTVTNAGPAVAQNVTVTDVMPAQVAYSSSSTTAGTCTYTASTTTVNCSLGSLSVGSTDVITISVSAQTFSSSVYSTNTATVSASTTDPNPNNNSSSFTSTIQSATAVDVSAFNAYTQADGSVRLVWHTQEESRNLGFHVYREDGSGRQRVDTALIAGSALLLRGSMPQHAAKTYAAVDAQPSASGAYWLEDVDINGTRTLHGPVYPEAMPVGAAPSRYVTTQSAVAVSPSLAQLNASTRANITPSGHALFIPRPVTQPRIPVLPSGLRLFNAADLPAVKITVNQVGWYHVPFSQLFAAGLNPYTDVRTLHLYSEGVEQPILLVGHTTGEAAPTDAIEFYGTGIDTPFTADRAYWLVTEGSAGARIPLVPGVASQTPTSSGFPYTVTREDRTVYFAALLNGENNDNFFGAVISSEPTDQTLNVVHLETSSTQPQTLQVALQGATDQQQHSVSIQLNGNSVGTLDFYGEVLSTQSYSIDPSMLVEGTNTVTLTALDGDNDVSLVQSIQLQYPHTYTADSDWLQATVPAGSELHISGFANSQVRVFDITNPLNIFEITGKTAPESGSYSVTAALPVTPAGDRTILAFAADAISAPEAIIPHAPTLLDQQRAGADIVVITYPDFASHLTPLVNLRESQGHKVLVVTTDQVFDDYSYGQRTPFAIRSFLQDAASRWQTKPQAVLLVGDASMDPRDYLGFGNFDFVPTRIIETAALKTASDDWFSDFLQNGYATIATGRLPARTTADVDLLVSKIVNYEQGIDAGSWNAQAVVIADQNVDSNFSSAAASATGSLPASLQTAQIYANGADPTTVHSQIVSALNNGTLLVDYNGHGAEQQWSFADLFDNTDASALTNGNRLPVYLLIDCLNGLFQDVYAQSLSKALILAPNGGAVAVWASSGFTVEAPQASMNIALLQQLAANPNDPFGLMILHAKNLTTDSDVRRTWNLLGDPSMKFHFAPGASPTSASHASSNKKPPINFPVTCSRGFSCLKETPKP